jgi:hypothetical protein
MNDMLLCISPSEKGAKITNMATGVETVANECWLLSGRMFLQPTGLLGSDGATKPLYISYEDADKQVRQKRLLGSGSGEYLRVDKVGTKVPVNLPLHGEIRDRRQIVLPTLVNNAGGTRRFFNLMASGNIARILATAPAGSVVNRVRGIPRKCWIGKLCVDVIWVDDIDISFNLYNKEGISDDGKEGYTYVI